VEQVAISGRDGQSPSDHHGTANLLNRLNFPEPTRGTVVQVAGNGVPAAVSQMISVLTGSEVHDSAERSAPQYDRYRF